ncbi:Integrin beta-like protein [Actinidia chinensis var. chinensis]|uniref:Integrin beta-like protein n=1 Tax=Actinidia chinensis var. chinensis TaxID=1590841 RepID=A0A2R6RYR8_ACTCC|nr:Integrin beta-like protein [Actinidia chinensis var. chinensis]
MTVIESRDRNKSNSGFDFGKSKIEVYVHSQVLRIREEDSHLGEDIGASLSAKTKISAADNHRRDRDPVICSSHMDFVVFSRPILPPSPLGGKMNAANTVR